MELKALTLTNFRVFKKETPIPFSPLTIITGANSSGKSSVFKALMLLQDNLERNQFPWSDITKWLGEAAAKTLHSDLLSRKLY